MNHRRIAPCLLVVLGMLAGVVTQASAYYASYEYYSYATYSDNIPVMDDQYLEGQGFTQGEYTKTGAHGNFGYACFRGSLAAATVNAAAQSHGLQFDTYNFAVGTGRVENISVMDYLTFTVPAGEYPAGVSVGLEGHSAGTITSGVGAGAEAGLWVSLGGEVYQTGVLVVGVAEEGTITVGDNFSLTLELVAPGSTLNQATDYIRQVVILIHRGRTWSVKYNPGGGYVTGDGSIDFMTGDRGLSVDEVVVPAGVNWTSESGVFLTAVSDVRQAAVLPGPVLHQNHPNPFNPATTIAFDLVESGPVDLRIYDVAGHLVRHLVQNQVLPAGPGRVVWRGNDDTGAAVATGVYLYRLKSAGSERVRRMVLLR